MWYMYTVEYHSAIKKNEIIPLAATWTDLEIFILSEVSLVESKKWHTWTNLQNRNRACFVETDVENKLTFTTGRRGEGIIWEVGSDIYTLLYIKQITNKDILYTMRNSPQYSVLTRI